MKTQPTNTYRPLDSITNKEAIEIGNLAFRKILSEGHTEPYKSKKWRLHIFQSPKRGLEKIAIVDETTPLMHIDDLWGKRPFGEMRSHSHWLPSPQYNWIEITTDFVIYHHSVTDIYKLLEVNSQLMIFEWLDKNNFFQKAVTW